jgi:hypothetical protein
LKDGILPVAVGITTSDIMSQINGPYIIATPRCARSSSDNAPQLRRCGQRGNEQGRPCKRHAQVSQQSKRDTLGSCLHCPWPEWYGRDALPEATECGVIAHHTQQAGTDKIPDGSHKPRGYNSAPDRAYQSFIRPVRIT